MISFKLIAHGPNGELLKLVLKHVVEEFLLDVDQNWLWKIMVGNVLVNFPIRRLAISQAVPVYLISS